MLRDERKDLSRRHFMRNVAIGGVALGAGAVLIRSETAKADSAELSKLFKGKKLADGTGKVNLSGPAIAENGKVVPLTVSMADGSKAKAVYLFVDENPSPLASKLVLKSGAPYLSTNIRMKQTSTVRGIVEMADGSVLQTTRTVKVTIGGCGG